MNARRFPKLPQTHLVQFVVLDSEQVLILTPPNYVAYRESLTGVQQSSRNCEALHSESFSSYSRSSVWISA